MPILFGLAHALGGTVDDDHREPFGREVTSHELPGAAVAANDDMVVGAEEIRHDDALHEAGL
ncbi:MAG: hypothetical protein DHS20C15_33380 [Planctomycetota bacterium]|nr:MAG: hypothetical protein DHS20C15_33380 [Planctomycetota bacterium]